MATYGQLLIDAGGGVIDHGKQSERQDGATLVIGLGGTGSDAVIKLKKEVYKQLKPDDINAVIPRYGAIKYLIVDSEDSKLKEQTGKLTDIDPNTEFFSLSNSTIKATFAAKKVMDNRPELYWLDYEHISIDDASAGAGGIRQVGRFLLVDKAAALYATIKSAMEGALTAAKTGKLNIHICTGISGGTGSGTFLDICYLVRKALQEIGMSEAKVCGYFFLPDVNLSVPEIQKNPLISDYIKVNGYSALQELDYCMNFGKNKDSFRMNYGFDRVDFSMKPVDLCYLISTTDSTGNRIQNGYQYAMGVVTDYIINFLAKVQLPAGVDADNNNGLTLEGHIANLNSIKAGIRLQHGANVDYNILGASVAEMPLSEIATYLGSKLFESYRDMYDRVPTEKQRDEFLMANQLQYEDIRRELTNKCANGVTFSKAYDAKMYKTMGNHRFVDRAAAFLAENKGEIENNCKNLIESLGEYNIPKNSTSLIGRTFKALCDSYATNFDYGPFFAKRMLFGNDNQNLIHAVDGFIAKNSENLAHELRQARIRDDEYNEAKIRMDNANFTNEKKRLEEYLGALNNLYVHHYRVEVYQTMDTVLQEYKKLLLKLDHNFFHILTIVLDTLRETFAVNAQVLSEGEKKDNVYTWKILSIPDIQEGLDEVVKKLDLGQTLYDLMMTLLENCKKWINQDENEIVKLISDFILQEFSAATKKTMTDYLKEKFEVDNAALLADAVEQNIIVNKLWKDSTPLFWQNPMYHNPVGAKSTLTVPFDSSEIKSAAYSFRDKQGEAAVRESGITDKLSMMRFYSGLPMYAYQGILELQRAYEADNKPGRHLYERGDVDWNKLLPAPVPASFEISIPVERIAKRNKGLIDEFEEAEKLGIVVKDELGNWNIQRTGDIDLENELKELSGGREVKELDANTLKEVIVGFKTKTDTLLQNIMETRIEYLNSVAGSEKQVMLDFYLMSPVCNRLLHNELVKRKEIAEKTEELNEQLQGKVKGTKGKNDFFNAIFTGVLPYGKKIVFTYEEFGIPKSVELQNNSMEYGQSGAYQAYLTYQELDDAIKKKIDVLTRARLDEDDCAEMKVAVENLDKTMQQRIAGYMSVYEGDLKRQEMEEFYTDFMKALQNFKLLNM